MHELRHANGELGKTRVALRAHVDWRNASLPTHGNSDVLSPIIKVDELNRWYLDSIQRVDQVSGPQAQVGTGKN